MILLEVCGLWPCSILCRRPARLFFSRFLNLRYNLQHVMNTVTPTEEEMEAGLRGDPSRGENNGIHAVPPKRGQANYNMHNLMPLDVLSRVSPRTRELVAQLGFLQVKQIVLETRADIVHLSDLAKL